MKNKDMMTDSDVLGTQRAIKESIEKRFGIWREQRLPGPIMALESLDDLKAKDEERKKDGFSPKIKFRRALVGPGKVIIVPYVEEERLIHAEFEPKNIIAATSQLDDDEGDIDETTGHGEGEVGDVI